MSHAEKTNTPTLASKEFYFYGEPAAVVLQRIQTRLESKTIAEVEAVLHALWVLEKIVLFSEMNVEGKRVEIDWLYSLVNKMLAPKVKTFEDGLYIGWLVHGLILFGSPRIQAIGAIAEWGLKSETKVKNAHRLLKKQGKTFGIDDTAALVRELSSSDINLRNVMISITKPFPQSFPKAASAYEKMKLAFGVKTP